MDSISCGFDKISISMIKLTMPHSLLVIKAIVNKSLFCGIFTGLWMRAVISPIPKKSKVERFAESRPISLLPALSKIVEKAINQQITGFLEGNLILPIKQSDLRRNHSTMSDLVNITDDILTACESSKSSIFALLNFTRAFDCVVMDTHDEVAVLWLVGWCMLLVQL